MEIESNFKMQKCYTCRVKLAVIEEPGTEISSFNGEHKQGKTNEDVEVLIIANKVVKYFPRGIEKFFPNLRFLSVLNCGLKKIENSDLKGFVHLEFLQLSYNNLTKLPNDLFLNMQKLQWIHFEHNSIESISSELIEPIKDHLKSINFRGNNQIDDYYRKDENKALEGFLAAVDQNYTPPVDKLKPLDYPSQSWMEQLFTTGKFSDFTIIFRGKKYKVHKVILAAQSSVFEKRAGDLQEQNLKQVKNFTEEAFEEFLAYFYTGKLKSADHARELFELAAEFDVPDLKSLCETLILGSLDGSNFQDVYNIGCARSSVVLKEAAFKDIKKIFPELKDGSIDDTQFVNDLINTKTHLDELRDAAANKPE